MGGGGGPTSSHCSGVRISATPLPLVELLPYFLQKNTAFLNSASEGEVLKSKSNDPFSKRTMLIVSKESPSTVYFVRACSHECPFQGNVALPSVHIL